MEGGRSLRRWISPLFHEEPESTVYQDPLDDDMRERLKNIFLYYISYLESHSMETMSKAQFSMFCRDCNFIQPREGEKIENAVEGALMLMTADIDVIYIQAIKDQERKATEEVQMSHLYDHLS